MELIIANSDPGEIRRARLALLPFSIGLLELNKFTKAPLERLPKKRGTEEIAIIRAREASALVQGPVLALSFALFLDGIALEDQPGVLVHHPSAPGLWAPQPTLKASQSWQELFKAHRGEVHGRWDCGVAVAERGGAILSLTASIPRFFTDNSAHINDPGFSQVSLQGGSLSILAFAKTDEDSYWSACLGAPLAGAILRFRKPAGLFV